ncbi:hypothetical protein B0H13DRAFT_1885828 [Mycena leptocephala]|nr:hypothetical protein B0H13DRAFT_1885828 [Mycena leptocephala]
MWVPPEAIRQDLRQFQAVLVLGILSLRPNTNEFVRAYRNLAGNYDMRIALPHKYPSSSNRQLTLLPTLFQREIIDRKYPHCQRLAAEAHWQPRAKSAPPGLARLLHHRKRKIHPWPYMAFQVRAKSTSSALRWMTIIHMRPTQGCGDMRRGGAANIAASDEFVVRQSLACLNPSRSFGSHCLTGERPRQVEEAARWGERARSNEHPINHQPLITRTISDARTIKLIASTHSNPLKVELKPRPQPSSFKAGTFLHLFQLPTYVVRIAAGVGSLTEIEVNENAYAACRQQTREKNQELPTPRPEYWRSIELQGSLRIVGKDAPGQA